MSNNKSTIIEALLKLDPATDEHWTSDGQPKVDVVQTLASDGTITRKNIIDAAPDFTRSNTKVVDEAPPEPTKEEKQVVRDREGEIKSAVADIDQKIGELQKRKTLLVAEADDLVAKRPASHRNAHVGAVKGYLASQKAQRAKKRGR